MLFETTVSWKTEEQQRGGGDNITTSGAKREAIENLEVFFKRVAWSLLLLHSKRRNLRLFHHSEFRPTFSIPEGEMPVYVIIINLIWG